MHDDVVTMVRENWTRDRQRHFLYYRLKPRLALTPYLFAQVMHKLTRHIEDEVLGACHLTMILYWFMRTIKGMISKTER